MTIPATLTVSVCGAKRSRGFVFPIGRKASENIWPIGQNVFDSCFSAAGHKEMGDKICTILLASSRRFLGPHRG